MIASKRHQEILNELQKKNVISVQELAIALNTSVSTIRRDLDFLEQSVCLKRTRGGAVQLDKVGYEPIYGDRTREYALEKEAIAKVAAEMIQPEDVIALDSGTTTGNIVKYLPRKVPITIITPAINVAVELYEWEDVTVILAGGVVRAKTMSLVGDMAEKNLAQFRATKVFMGCSTFSFKEGTMNYNLPAIGVKRALASMADEIIVLVDHSKFGKDSLASVVPIDKITTIITDWKTSQEHIMQLKERGINVLVAPESIMNDK